MSSVTRKNRNPLFHITQLKLQVDISVPDSKPFLLTSDRIMYTGSKKLELYPMFTDSVPYPYSYLIRQKYDKIVEFFFIKSSFMSILKISTSANVTQNSNKKRTVRKTKLENKKQNGGKTMTENGERNGEKNFKMMLSLLFPISYPTTNNIHDSYSIVTSQIIWANNSESDMIIPPDEMQTTKQIDPVKQIDPDEKNKTTNFYGMIRNLFSNTGPQKMSYIKYENKEYTVTEIIWLNDFLNYPTYTDLLDKYEIFLEKKSEDLKTKNVDADIIALFKELVEQTKSKDLIVVVKTSYKSLENANTEIINAQFNKIKSVIEGTSTNPDTDIVKMGELLFNLYTQINNKNITYETRIILSNLQKLYEIRQLNIILAKFEKTFDTKYINESEKQAILKSTPYVFKLGESIQNIKKRLLSNKTLQKVLDKPSEYNSQFTRFMDFVESYKYGEGADTEYAPEDIKILFDRVMETKSSENETFIEVFILMNVIENKYDPNTISTIDCHYKDQELAILKNQLHTTDNYWNMKLRKHYFSDKKYIDEIQNRYKNTTDFIPTPIESDILDKKKGNPIP